MDAAPLLARIAQVLEKHALETVLIGNAAAALQGAPVTTVDFDFFFRKTPANLKKLKRIAADLGAIALHPYYPAKKAAGRPRGLAMSKVFDGTLDRRLLTLPPEKRTHFLRKRIAWRMSAL